MNQAVKNYASSLPFPFAAATETNGVLYLSGQVSMTANAEPLYGDIATQTANILASIRQTLERLDSNMESIFKVTVWLSDMKHFAEFNQEYARWFQHGYPARSVVSSRLVFDLDVEIEVQAVAQKTLAEQGS
ncbi:RidA family protein [Erwiniaceae bacterium L1_54_6]|jgi:2-iminobutanoate/2-iminopropanoate deaminase|nr:RidA family protein [Erwiniaceae bacterium L1_54_6]